MKTVIYGLFCPLAGAIRYIGKSCEPEKRLYAHIYAADPLGTCMWETSTDEMRARMLSNLSMANAQ